MGTACKHIGHVGNALRDEATDVQRRQCAALPEHPVHTRHIRRVQVLQSNKGLQMRNTSEPIGCARNSGAVGKRL